MSDEPAETPQPDLQRVLLRYADSREGFSEAARLTDQDDLARAFREIAERRKQVARRISAMIQHRGDEPEQQGSLEGAAHRWWIRLRESTDGDGMKALLEECVRGEEVLAGTIEDALKEIPDLTPANKDLLREALAEVREAIETFQVSLH